MWVELFLCLLLAHLIADFALQTSESCKSNREKKWRSSCHYTHAAIVFALSWMASYCLEFWWCALVIAVTHFAIDLWKSYREDKVEWFVVDQLLHVAILALVAWQWSRLNGWSVPFGIATKYMVLAVAIIVCWKPANIFIKLMLKRYSVNVPDAHSNSGFNAGALIGNIERWMILSFVIMQRYEALGLLIAAKSIIRFGEKETAKTEYVLAGTLMSIFIAVLAGLIVNAV